MGKLEFGLVKRLRKIHGMNKILFFNVNNAEIFKVQNIAILCLSHLRDKRLKTIPKANATLKNVNNDWNE